MSWSSTLGDCNWWWTGPCGEPSSVRATLMDHETGLLYALVTEGPETVVYQFDARGDDGCSRREHVGRFPIDMPTTTGGDPAVVIGTDLAMSHDRAELYVVGRARGTFFDGQPMQENCGSDAHHDIFLAVLTIAESPR